MDMIVLVFTIIKHLLFELKHASIYHLYVNIIFAQFKYNGAIPPTVSEP